MRAEIKENIRRAGGESERSAAVRAEAARLAAAAAQEVDAKDEADAVRQQFIVIPMQLTEQLSLLARNLSCSLCA